jgi:hypothetical protein
LADQVDGIVSIGARQCVGTVNSPRPALVLGEANYVAHVTPHAQALSFGLQF